MKKTICIAFLLTALFGCDLEKIEPEDTLFDYRDGQSYKIVKIGSQVWMAENLNYAGTPNNEVGHCYDDNPVNCGKYGRLYEWTTVMAGESESSTVPSRRQGICPDGSHIPSKAEFDTLINFLGGESIAGAKLKTVNHLWNSLYVNEEVNSCFMALPAGCYNCSVNVPGYEFEGASGALGFLTTTKCPFLGTGCSGDTFAVSIDLVDFNLKAQEAPICPTDKRLSCRCVLNQ